MKTKVCCKCHTAKPTTEFYRSAAAKDSLQSQCKSCMIAYQTAYRRDSGSRVARRDPYECHDPVILRDGTGRIVKTCLCCHVTKRSIEFNRDDSTEDLLQSWCKSCATVSLRSHTLWTKYGLSPADYAEMVLAQDGKCAICGLPETAVRRGKLKALAVDHDYETGKVRGLLCQKCNVMLGMACDDPIRLRAAAKYLQKNLK